MNISIHLASLKKEYLKEKPSQIKALSQQHVMPGQVITTETGYLRGHGTYEKDNKLYASVSGVIERVNKLISVKPLKARYRGEIGDVIVGRITEVGQKAWRVDINGKMEAMLQLQAINLPGGVLRRRTTTDELQMRSFFVENDVISAEVQQIHSDGLLALHTRSLKYGKLLNGQLIKVHPVLIRRVKNHFHSFPFHVDIILGLNGNIWISQSDKELNNEENNINFEDEIRKIKTISPEVRECISRVRNSIVALNQIFSSIHPDSIMEVYQASLNQEIDIKDMLKPNIIIGITSSIRSTRS